MRILYTSASVDIREEGLGGKTHFIEVAKNLKELGNSLLVLVSGYRPRNKISIEFPPSSILPLKGGGNGWGCNLNIKYIYIPAFPKRSVSYVVAEFFRFFYLTFYILKFRPEVIYSREDKWGFSPPLLSFIFKIPYIVEVNGLISEELKRYSHYPAWIMWLVVLSEKINYLFAKKIICVAPGIKREIVKRYKVREENLAMISNGANIKLFRPLEKLAPSPPSSPLGGEEIGGGNFEIPDNEIECQKKLGLDENGFYIGFVGYFAPWQGLEILIDAADLVKKRGYPDIKYLIVGDGGGLKKSLQTRVEKYNLKQEISFLGHIKHQDIVHYINAFDVAVAPFTGERNKLIGLSPLKLYEYLACGKPVIASRIEGVSEVVEEGGCGYLFDPEDATDLAEKIIQVYQERQYLTQLGTNGRKLIEEKYSWRKTAERIMEVVDRGLKVC